MGDDVKARLMALCAMPEDTIEIPGVGQVKLRGLSRSEVVGLGVQSPDLTQSELFDLTVKVVSKSLVEPKLTGAQVDTLMNHVPADVFNILVDTAMRLSGLDEGASKDVVSTFHSEP